MGTSLLFGVIASTPLIIGSLIGIRFELPKRLLAILLAFAAGSLITALAFELFLDAYEHGGLVLAAVGLFAGAVVFTVLSALLDKWAQPGGKDVPADEYQGSAKLDTDAAAQEKRSSSTSTRGAAGLALLAAVTLDGVPENVALGVALGGGSGGLALLAAIFVSNLPEALVGVCCPAGGGRRSGRRPPLRRGPGNYFPAPRVRGRRRHCVPRGYADA